MDDIDAIMGNPEVNMEEGNAANEAEDVDDYEAFVFDFDVDHFPSSAYSGIDLASTSHVSPHDLGAMTFICEGCGAYHWKAEKTSGTLARPMFSRCCSSGKVVLPNIFDAPATLAYLYYGESERSRRFLKKIRAYNNAFSFVSLGNTRDMTVAGNGVYTYKVQGQVYHQIGSLLPQPGGNASFAQLYFLDTSPDAELTQRLAFNQAGTDRDTAAAVQQALRWVNPYACFLRTSHDEMNRLQMEHENVAIKILAPDPVNGLDLRRYNRPTASEVAAVVVNLSPDRSLGREIVYFLKNGPPRRIKDIHPSFLPLRFPILIPYGHFGWTETIVLGADAPRELMSNDPAVHAAALEDENVVYGRGRGGSVHVTQLQFHAFHLHPRLHFSTLLRARNLLQEYVVDAWACIEQSRLDYNLFNQDQLRADLYNGVKDALLSGTDLNNIGTRVILPSSFTGGPRFWLERYHDAMALVRRFKRPDLFITMTCNPQWPEISSALYPGQTAADRPDLVCRVFWLKLKELIDTLYKSQVLGRVRGYVYSVEFQKRGLPHAHILLFLHPDDRLRSSAAIDQVVVAELPDPALDPDLHRLVLAHMVHGPCTPALPCMQDPRCPGQCSKRYPRAFRDDTDPEVDGYPEYRRRAASPTAEISSRGQTRAVDARWVVPHNPYLLKRFECHINVEISTSIRAVKYLFKYVFKGSDGIAVATEDAIQQADKNNDEIAAYLNARYISPAESVARIFGLKLHGIKPSVQALDLHLENHQRFSFDPNDPSGTADRIDSGTADSKLMAFFKLCARKPKATATLTYDRVCERYRWDSKLHEWKNRVDPEQTAAVGRVYFSPKDNSDRFYLRMLLFTIPSPKSFVALRTVDGNPLPTFRDACAAHGMLADDAEWHLCMTEAAHLKPGSALRRLFCVIVTTEVVDDRRSLYLAHAEHLADDCARRLQRRGIANPSLERVQSYSRGLIYAILRQMRPDTSPEEYGVPPPLPEFAGDHEDIPAVLSEELYRNPQYEAALAEHKSARFHPDQTAIYTALKDAFHNQDPSRRLFFLNGPGGCGKTFLENTFLAYVRGQGHVALAVAASGIAALMLDGGRTAHSRFRIPFVVDADSVCPVSAQSAAAELVRRTSVVVWDEAPMQHRHCFEAVDRMFRDIRKDPSPFGGALVVFSGDWAQTLPVVRDGKRPELVDACLHQSRLWKNVSIYNLTVNLRLLRNLASMDPRQAEQQLEYARWVESVSRGSSNGDRSLAKIPDGMRFNSDSPDSLIEFVYGDMQLARDPLGKYWSDRAILHARNLDVDETNEAVFSKIAGDITTLYSADLAMTPGGEVLGSFTNDYLNELRPAGLPPHKLELKRGVPIMMLRNLDPHNGLCNGTRLVVDNVTRRVIEARILTGADHHLQRTVYIPRISVHTGQGVFPFTLCRRQFPVKLCFAMTVNKSQGQSISKVGIDLRFPSFAHGQLYVALSRATHACDVRVLLPVSSSECDSTPNVVMQDAFPS